MARYRVSWEVTEVHEAVIDLAEGEAPDGEYFQTDWLAPHETDHSFIRTEEREVRDWAALDETDD